MSLSAEELTHHWAERDSFDEIDDLDLWALTLMNPINIDNHIKHLRSAWEGSTAFLVSPNDPSRAQHLVDTAVRSVNCREDDYFDLPN